MGYDTLAAFATACLFAALVLLWYRFFPTYEDLCELTPIVRALATCFRWMAAPARAFASRWGRVVGVVSSPLRQVSPPSWEGWDTPEQPPERIERRTAALGRIHRMNGDGGGLSLPDVDANAGGLALEDTSGALSVAEPKK